MQEPEFEWDSAGSADANLAEKIGLTLLLANNFEGHERFCQRRFIDLLPDSPTAVAYRILKPVLARQLKPDSELMGKAVTWVGAIERDPRGIAAEGVGLVRAMVAYRSGRYEQAIEASKTVDKSRLAMAGTAQIFRAMALAKSGRLEEGKQELHQAEARLSQHLANMTGDYWWDLALFQLALDEAHRLFEQQPDGHDKGQKMQKSP